MSASDYSVEELRCHHGNDELGHACGAGCPVRVRRGVVAASTLLVEWVLRPDVVAAREALRARRCMYSTQRGVRCRGRASLRGWPLADCGRH